MKEFKEKGFTLIELLATIVILGIIALITVPTVKKVMDNARRKAFEDTAYGIIKAGDLYYSKKDMMDEIDGDMTFTFPDNAEELDLQGKLPENGTMQINEDGEISIFITNEQYCITKNYKEKDITVTEDVERCLPPVMVENITVANNNVSINKGKTSKIEVNFVPTTATNKKLKYTSSNTNVAKVDENGLITGVGAGNATITVSTTDSSNISKTINVTVKEPVKTLSDLATTSTEVTSIPECITNNTTCTAGTLVAIKVNKTETYNFYVISETDNKVTLIMDRNLGDNVKWYADAQDNSHGPTTAVATLKERTAGWTNIPEKEYTYSDDGGGNNYTAFTETMRARMITYTEAKTTLGCTSGSCPSWLYINLKNTGSDTDSAGASKYGYWTSAAFAGTSHYAHIIVFTGNVANTYTSYSNYGVRPVIELSKSL